MVEKYPYPNPFGSGSWIQAGDPDHSASKCNQFFLASPFPTFPEHFVQMRDVVDVNSKTRLDNFWSCHDVRFDWTVDLARIGDRSECVYLMNREYLSKKTWTQRHVMSASVSSLTTKCMRA